MTFDRKAWRDQWKGANPDKVGEQIKRDYASKRLKRGTETPEEREARLVLSRAKHKKWRDANPEHIKAYTVNDRAKNMDRIKLQLRTRAMFVKYGITMHDYEFILAAQGALCAICGTDKATAKHTVYNWRVDHCHNTGKVRALLCHNCNIALGLMKENTSALQSMIDYINHHNLPEEVNHHGELG